MAAPTNAANVKKVLVNSEPSTHGTSCRFVATHKNSVAIEGIADILRSLAARRSDANDPIAVVSQGDSPALRRAPTDPRQSVMLFTLWL